MASLETVDVVNSPLAEATSAYAGCRSLDRGGLTLLSVVFTDAVFNVCQRSRLFSLVSVLAVLDGVPGWV